MTQDVEPHAGSDAGPASWRRPALVVIVLMMVVTTCTAGLWTERGLTRRLIEDSGLVLIGVAIVGRAWCTLFTSGRRPEQLITIGPYSISRHPIHFFTLLAVAGMGAQSGSMTLALLFVVAALTIILPLIRSEEALLARTEPSLFARYRRITPRLMPRIGLWRAPEELVARPESFNKTLVDGLPFLVAWPLLDMISVLQHAELAPVLLRWP